MKKNRKINLPAPKKMTTVDYLCAVEYFIARNTTPPATRGKNKGHGTTNTFRWLGSLAMLCHNQIQLHSQGKQYDGNMALAATLGLVLCAWYAQVQRAKGFDPNRPLSRRQVFRKLAKFKSELTRAISDDRIMGAVWGKQQEWNFPFGKGAKGGKFV